MQQHLLEEKVKHLEIRLVRVEDIISWAQANDPEFLFKYHRYVDVMKRMENKNES